MQHKLTTIITQEERERWWHKHKGDMNFTALNNEIHPYRADMEMDMDMTYNLETFPTLQQQCYSHT